MSLKRFFSNSPLQQHLRKSMSSPYLTDVELRLALGNYVTQSKLNSWMSDTSFQEAVRRAVRDETMWSGYFSALARRDLMESVNREVEGIPKKVKQSVQLQLPEVLQPHLNTFKDAIPSHVSRAMLEQATAFFGNHAQTQQLLDRVVQTLEQKSSETLDRVVKEEKYHEMSRRLEKEIQARGESAVQSFDAHVKTHLQTQNERFGVRLNEMQEQVNAKVGLVDEVNERLGDDEKEMTELKNSLRNTQIVLGFVTFAGVAALVGTFISKV